MDIIDRMFGLVDEMYKEQQDFAREVEVHPTRVSEWRKRKSHSYVKRLEKISKALETTPEYLLTGEGPKHKTKAVSDSDTTPENRQAAAPEGSGLTEEFAKLFSTLTPENQNRIIAEMLKRQREQ